MSESHSVRNQIVIKLMMTTTPLKTNEIARSLDIDKAVLNSFLYELLGQGKIVRTSETPPMWVYNKESSNILDREGEIMNLLKKRDAMSSHSLVFESHLPKKTVNRILYDLERSGRVERLQVSPPIWGVPSSNKRKLSSSNEEDSIALEYSAKDGDGILEKKQSNKERSYSCSLQQMGAQKKSRILESCSSKKKSANRCFKHENVDEKLAKNISDAVWSEYGKKSEKHNIILAGYVLRKQTTNNKSLLEVIALGTGTKAVPGEKFSLNGTVVHDSHAEVVARRSLQRWLYKHLSHAGQPFSCALKSAGDKPFVLKSDFELWFYTSQAPCGDSAIFSRNDPQPKEVPCFTTSKHGIFHTKVEESQGTTGHLIACGTQAVQPFDGWQYGNKAQCHSCSDKIAKRCVLGVQGALLSQLISPLYVTGIIIGDVFSYGHATRAICCRSQIALQSHDKYNTLLSSMSCFHLHHPLIGHHPLDVSRKFLVKKKNSSNKLSMNWVLGDDHVEWIDSTTGRLDNNESSRISKKSLFLSFQSLIRTIVYQGRPNDDSTYRESKKEYSKPYQTAKKLWVEAMCKQFHTKWISKPSEVDDFRIVKK